MSVALEYRQLSLVLAPLLALWLPACLRITKDEADLVADDDRDGTPYRNDCDDADTAVYPGAVEQADLKDNDCDGVVDEGTTNSDDDGDGWAEADGDCDDADSDRSPSETEECGDGVDNNCDGNADEEDGEGCTVWYEDLDQDLYGSADVPGRCLCSPEGSYTSRLGTDCYDYNADAHPGSPYYGTVARGDTSFDYDCDLAEDPYYHDTYSCNDFYASCTLNLAGWQSGVASCGSTETYVTDCSIDWFECDLTTISVTQSCK